MLIMAIVPQQAISGSLSTLDLYNDPEVASLEGDAVYLRELCLSFRDHFSRELAKLDVQEREDILEIFGALGTAVDQAQATVTKHREGCDKIEQFSEDFRVRFDDIKSSLIPIAPEVEHLQVYDANCPTPMRLMSSEGMCGLYLT